MTQVTGPSSSQSPYLVATNPDVSLTSILSVGDQVGTKDGPAQYAGQPWRFAGIPDGIGVIDNGDGTLTVLVNHELTGTAGFVRDHGSTGAFVDKLTVDANTLQVLAAEDLIKTVYTYDRTASSYVEGTTQISRLCSADLAPVSAFYDATTGLGTTDRIFLNGEETGVEGRAFAHIVTGAEAGDSYELPYLGRFSWENSLANAYSGEKTVVVGTDDSTPGEVYLYVGDKKADGNAIEKAGLTGGDLYGILASFGDDVAATPSDGTFTLVAQGNNGDVSHTTGTELQAASGPITQFGRPEDGAWDPSNPNRFYFVTTGTATVPTRLWQLDFYDIEHPELGGTIKVAVEGVYPNSDPASAAPLMIDNITVTESGLVVMQEDPGNNARLAKVWVYDPKADDGSSLTSGLTELAQHDPARFGVAGTPAPGGMFNQDEESSGITDVTSLLGNDERLAFLLDTQAHYSIGGELVEGGQLQALYYDLPNPGDSTFRGTAGADSYDGGFGDDNIRGGNGDDNLIGNYGDDSIDGGNGNDEIDAGPGNDNVHGGNGDDHIVGGTGDDKLYGDAGKDLVEGGVGNDLVDGGAGDDVAKGGFGDDKVLGGSGNDELYGEQGADTLDGGAGNDHLYGGSGADILTGGRGSDTFHFASASDYGDTITDFRSGDDKIALDITGDASLVRYIGFRGAQDTAVDGTPSLLYDRASGDLFFDDNGGATTDAVLVAHLDRSPNLARTDILLTTVV